MGRPDVMKSFCHRCNETIDTDTMASCPACAVGVPEHGWPRDRRLGQVVVGGQYRVLRRLGAGGFGSVYLVETVVGGLRRALKVLNAEWTASEETRERFVNEALVLEQVNHPNVARCYAVGALEGENELYLLLELVEGVPLSTIVGRPDGPGQPLPPARAVRIATQVASGLVAAHANQILHRDLKPENILVVNAGATDEQVKLIDFGIARSLDGTQTSTRGMVGTPHFMAPEQLQPGEGPDARLDLWQLGAVMFYLLTGDVPYRAERGRISDLMTQHERRLELGPAPSERHPALLGIPALDRLVARLLATNRDRRPRSAAQVCAELARIEHALQPSSATTSLALIEALCESPSEGAWWALCRYLTGLTSERDRLIAAAESLISDWPDEVRVAAASWWETVRHGEEHPLWPLARTLDLSGRGLTDDDVAGLAECRAMTTITRLSLADNALSNAGVQALVTSPHLPGLRWLDLGGNRITSAGAERLAESCQLRRLVSLSLAGNGLGPRGAEALARATCALRWLDLSDNDIQAAGAAALASSEHLGGLESLRLRGNGLGSDGLGALAVSRHLTELRELDLASNGIGPSGAAALALSANVGHLRRLSLAQNSLGLEGVELLLASNRFATLESLDLGSNGFGAQGAMVLASSPFARRLKRLRLSDDELGDAGLAALLGAHHLAGLRELDVSQNGLTAAGAMLLGGTRLELDVLDLSENALGGPGVPALADALGRMRVRELRVAGCGFDGDALARVLRAGGTRLTTLVADRNALGADGAMRLGATPEATVLSRLDVASCGIGAEGVEALSRSPYLKGLRELRLDSNGLGDEGGAVLTRSLDALPNLQDLRLADNRLGPKAAAALASSPLAARLTSLGLAHNVLGDEGATALAHGANWHVLRELDLERNDIGMGAAAAVLAAPGMALLCRVRLARNALTGQLDLHSLSRGKVALLESSFAALATRGADFAERFYQEFFTRYPGVKPLFAGTSMRQQQQHLMDMLVTIIDHLRQPDTVARSVADLGQRHAGYGVCPSHYFALQATMLSTIRQMLGAGWTDEMEAAWRDGLEAIGAVMGRSRQGAAG